MSQISDVLATGSAYDIQLDVTKLKAFQLFIEALLHLTSEQQCELIIEEFYEDLLTVFTTCVEFTKKFTKLGLVDQDENKEKNNRKDIVASNPIHGCAVPPPTAVIPMSPIKSSRSKNTSSSGSRKNVPTASSKEEIPDSNQNDQKSSQEIISELLGECLSVAAICCDIYLSSSSIKSIREKQEGDITRRKTAEDRIVLRYV